MMEQRSNPAVCRKGIFLHDDLKFILYKVFIFSLFCLSSCKQKTGTSTTISSPASKEDLFKHKTQIRHSKGFSITYFNNYKLVKILNHFSGNADTLQYLLVQRGTARPKGYPTAQVVEIPVQSLVVTSSMHIGLADYAGAADLITGLADFKYISAPAVRKNMAAGKVKEVGMGSDMNNELLVAMHPGLIMTTGSPDARFSRYQTLIGAGVPVMQNAEWLETDPLARTEWVKLMGALLNKEEVVDKKFSEVEQEYNRLANMAIKAANKPSVIIGMPFKGSWFMPDGDSYMARFLHDAGASYQWSGVKGTGSLALDFEAVAPVALAADFWLHPSTSNSLQEIKGADTRFADFKPFKKGNVYNNNKRTNDIGSNDYWESGAVNPHIILADMIKILHPELLPDHQLVYYKKLP
jgi:iron complex transport system substrate-binding protein